MSRTKCRLCQCLVDKLTGFSCSLNDDGFRSMIKTVFPFPISPVHKVASKTYEMPVLVCFQCSTAIRNFYNFSKQVEATQKKLQAECMRKDDSLSIDELLLYIKAEPGLRIDVSDEQSAESLMMSADIEGSECEVQNIPNHLNISEDDQRNSPEPNDHQIEQDEEEEVIASAEKPVSCVDKSEVITSMRKMEKRINIATEKLGIALRNIKKSGVSIQTTPMYDSFGFDVITSKEECTVLNNQLADREYMEKNLQWLNENITSQDSRKRVGKALNLIFSRQFLAVCTWTGFGGSDKCVAFRNYRNILTLLRCAGTTHMSRVNDRLVMEVITTRLKNAKRL